MARRATHCLMGPLLSNWFMPQLRKTCSAGWGLVNNCCKASLAWPNTAKSALRERSYWRNSLDEQKLASLGLTVGDIRQAHVQPLAGQGMHRMGAVARQNPGLALFGHATPAPCQSLLQGPDLALASKCQCAKYAVAGGFQFFAKRVLYCVV